MRRTRVAGVGVASLLMGGVLFGQSPEPARQRELTNQQHAGSVYTQFGARTIINVAGSPTRVGGARCRRGSSRRWPTQPRMRSR